jgi:hypothetical protein
VLSGWTKFEKRDCDWARNREASAKTRVSSSVLLWQAFCLRSTHIPRTSSGLECCCENGRRPRMADLTIAAGGA